MLPYKPKMVEPLKQAHKDQRVNFCDWISKQTPEFIDKVIWSDEKWFVRRTSPTSKMRGIPNLLIQRWRLTVGCREMRK